MPRHCFHFGDFNSEFNKNAEIIISVYILPWPAPLDAYELPGMKALFQSISALSHCVVSLVNSPGVISTKIRLSIMSNYCQACGPHSVFALALTPALRHSSSFYGWEGTYSEVKVRREKPGSHFL